MVVLVVCSILTSFLNIVSAFIVKFKFIQQMLALKSRIRRYEPILPLVVVENCGAEEGDMLFLGLVSGYQRGGQIQ